MRSCGRRCRWAPRSATATDAHGATEKGGTAMHELLNTLYVTTERAYLHLDHDTLRMEVGGETAHRMPLLHLGGIVCFGNILISPALLHRCAEHVRSVELLDGTGRFKVRLEVPANGHVV